MKHIVKSAPPTSLETYKATEGARFDDMPKTVKEELRKSLVSEQGALCCYCGKRILGDHHSIIEHLYPKGNEKYSHLQLEYNNLLCSCDGGESERSGKPKSEKRKFPSFCDDKKNDQILPLTPLDPTCEDQFSYDEDGNIYGMTDGADEAIRILGLDCSPLVNARRQAIEPYVNMSMENAEWLIVIEDLLRRHDGVFLPFCFATVSYIRNFKMAG